MICYPLETPLGAVKYMNRNSSSKHLTSEGHRAQIQTRTEFHQKQTEAARLFQETYQGFTLGANQSFSMHVAASSYPSLFTDKTSADAAADSVRDLDTDSTAFQVPDVYNWGDEIIPSFHEQPDLTGEDERRRLEEQFEAMLARAQHEDEFGMEDDDEYLADELWVLGQSYFTLYLCMLMNQNRY